MDISIPHQQTTNMDKKRITDQCNETPHGEIKTQMNKAQAQDQ
jgi:hypothetical protein